MPYIDGFVIAVPRQNREAYRKLAADAAAIFKECGALSVVEAWGDDVPHGKQTDFYMAVQCREDEVPVFSWITWADKDARDAGNAKAMADPRMQPNFDTMPFDAKRMIFGGFDVIVDA